MQKNLTTILQLFDKTIFMLTGRAYVSCYEMFQVNKCLQQSSQPKPSQIPGRMLHHF